MKRLVPAILLGGCFGWSDPPAERPAPKLRNIADAQILDMKVNLYKQTGLCPGAEGKLYANANVQWPGQKPVARSIGNDQDSLPPSAFAVSGPLVRGDANAHLFPDADVLASMDTGFAAHIVYKPIPRFTFDMTFPPEYSCFAGWWDEGSAGATGDGGENGDSGGTGQNGGNGGHAGPGGPGGNGGHVVAYVTKTRTKFYPTLLAVVANNHFFLAPADRGLTFGAAGGAGGTGGTGGSGGNGGDQDTKSVDEKDENGNTSTVTVGVGPAGHGGSGGSGGNGGNGGNGGVVEVIYDRNYPDLQGLIQTDVSGGPGGYGGQGGSGGSGGQSSAARNAQTGDNGEGGPNAGDGGPGRSGRASVRAGDVTAVFQQVLGGKRGAQSEAPRPAEPEQPPAGAPPPPPKKKKHKRH